MAEGEPGRLNADFRELHQFLQTRCSVRAYLARPVEQQTLERLFESAARAPSAHNRQPWRFAVIRNQASKANLAAAMGSRLSEDRRRDGDPEDDIKADVERSVRRITGAPVVILVATSFEEMDAYVDPARTEAEQIMAIQSAAMSAQNLMLAAHAEGLASCWMCGPLFCPDVASAALSLPEDWRPQGLVIIGYPASQGRDRQRKPLPAFVRFD